MKELRFDANEGVWRVAFAFDPNRTGILLIAGDKHGKNETLFYEELIAKADARFAQHIEPMKAAKKANKSKKARSGKKER